MRPHKSPALGTVLLLIALNLLNYLDRYILNGAQPLIQSEFHATDEMMGRLTTALFFFYMFAAPASGWLGDWLRRKPLIITGAILWSLATLGTAFVHTYWGLFARRALVGVGEATFGIYAPAVLADFYPERDRNRISPSSIWPFPWARRSAIWRVGNWAACGDGAGPFSSAPFLD